MNNPIKDESLDYIYDWLETIKNTPGINDKVALLLQYLRDDGFLQIIKYMYDDSLHYGVKEMPLAQKHKFDRQQLFRFLNQLSEQKGTSDADKGKLAELCSVTVKTRKLIHKVINKDAKCGFGAKLINKAIPDTVYIEPYMRCSTEKKIDKIVYPAVVQQKADGMFVNVKVYKNGEIEFISRNGKKIHQLNKLKSMLQKRLPKKYYKIVLHGELLIKYNGEILDRPTGNGILNSCLSNTADQYLADCAILKVWDCISMKAYNAHYFDRSYIKRYRRTKKIVKAVKHKDFKVIRTKIIHSMQEAKAFYKLIRKLGGEGAILKNFLLKWKNHTATEAIKLKNVSEGEFRISGLNKGKKGTKWEKHIGSIDCESECGKVKFSVGGLTDEEHLRPWDEWMCDVGSVVSVEYDGLIKDKNRKGIWSLYLPRNLTLRPDRNYADTLEDLLKR
jgi:DNA ligase-1